MVAIPRRPFSLSIDAALGLGVVTALLYFVGRAKDVAFCRYFELPHEEFGLPPDALIAEGFRVVWGRLWWAVYLLLLISVAAVPAAIYFRKFLHGLKPRDPTVRRALYIGLVSAVPVLALVALRCFTLAAKNDGEDIAHTWHTRRTPVVLHGRADVEIRGCLIRTSTGFVALLTDPASRAVVITSHEEIRRIDVNH